MPEILNLDNPSRPRKRIQSEPGGIIIISETIPNSEQN